MSFALFRRNAEACENAKHPKCVCACGGTLHGTRHAEAWLQATWLELHPELREQLEAQAEADAREAELRARQLDWVSLQLQPAEACGHGDVVRAGSEFHHVRS